MSLETTSTDNDYNEKITHKYPDKMSLIGGSGDGGQW